MKIRGNLENVITFILHHGTQHKQEKKYSDLLHDEQLYVVEFP